MNWYSESIDKVLDFHKVSKDLGLNDASVLENQTQYGLNKLPEQKPTPTWILFIQQFNDPIIYILVLAGILNSFVSGWHDAIVIFMAVILNSVIGFVQESKAADALKALQSMTAPIARVKRNGVDIKIPTSEVTIGDLIVLESGDRVPADARLIDSHSLLIDESMLTGESFAIEKKHSHIVKLDSALGDRINMLYSGTIVQRGRGLAIVTGIGTSTEFGKISQSVAETEDAESPLQINVDNFGKKLSLSILIVVIGIFIVGFFQGNNWLNMLLTSVGLAVSAIPEGLPVSITITLSVGLYQMSKQNAVVKKLAAVETLGSTNVICSDKTGTLTKNQMTVMHLFAGGVDYDVSGSGYNANGEVIRHKDKSSVKVNTNKSLQMAAFIGNYCTESHIALENGEWKITGDSTESAVMIAAQKLGFEATGWEKFIDLPFESDNQFMAVRVSKDGKAFLLAKGGAERILDRCKDTIDADGNLIPLEHEALMNKTSEYANRGLRVLALAYAEIPNEHIKIEDVKELTLVGFAGIQDAVRDEVALAVKQCAEAGVRVVMITGDHIETARSVGKAVNIGMDKPAPVAIRGIDVEKMTDDELFDRVPDIDVYARVAPDHKYRIVSALQKHNKVVAMTGDGVNDAPALKKADIGIAMGSGSDVAKEASHMVLMDDNFTSIVSAIRHGRIILKNLQHILLYILATSFGGLLTIATSVLLGLPLPILPAQLLWINLVTDGSSTFPLAYEREHGNSMAMPPRKKDAPLIPTSMVYRIIFSGLLMMIGTVSVFWYELHISGNFEEIMSAFKEDPKKLMAIPAYMKAVTMAFCTLALFQIWNVQNTRSVIRSLFFNLPYNKTDKLDKIGVFSNPILLGVMVLALIAQFAAVLFPVMNNILRTVPLTTSTDWMIVTIIPFSIIIFVELIKFGTAIKNKNKPITF